MKTIKRLPEAVRNLMRSGIVLCDITGVVEELVFNSLDAGATKVFVYVGVGNSYVKVADDGSGISRDGLELLGERYATSKLHNLADMEDASGNIGFRGEALASISDASLLEITTKASGRPNGYRKVMKGSKCLYLGIDDERKDVGTTVVCRNLFYNQPVRRKYMQSSSRKVLHSVKQCVLQIALVHPKVSFKVVDMESEDELLCTHASSSPLALLMSSFRIEDFSFIHEVNATKGALKVSGYISSPFDSMSAKAFQYVYINSRSVYKGPIHKLLNHLAGSFDCSDSCKANNGSLKGKRSKSQACPAYLLNLRCPQSLYDLIFEPSKTHASFRDWELVLTFIEQAVRSVWMKNKAYGESLSCVVDKFGKDEMWKKHNIISAGEHSEWTSESSRFQTHKSYANILSFPSEDLSKEDGRMFHEECERISFQVFQIDPVGLEEKNSEMEVVSQPEYSSRLLDGSFAECLPTVSEKVDHHGWTIESSRFQDPQSSPPLLSPPSENPIKERDHMFHKDLFERTTAGKFQRDPAELEEENREMEYLSQPTYAFGFSDSSIAKCLPIVSPMIDHHAWEVKSSKCQFHKSSPHIYTSSLETLPKEVDHLFHDNCQRVTLGESQKHNAELEEENSGKNFGSQSKYSCSLLDGSFAECLSKVPHNPFSVDGDSSIQLENILLSSRLGNVYLQIEPGENNGWLDAASSLGRDGFSNEFEASKDVKVLLPQSYFSPGSLLFRGDLFSGSEERPESSVGCFKYKRKRICPNEMINSIEADVSNQSFDLFSRNTWQDKQEASCFQYHPRLTRESTNGFDIFSRTSLNLVPSDAEPSTKESNFLSDSIKPVWNSGSNNTLNFLWCSENSDPFFQGTSRNGQYTFKKALEGNFGLGAKASDWQFASTEENYTFTYDRTLRRFNQENCNSVSSGLGFEDCDHSSRHLSKYLQQHKPLNQFSREHFDDPFDRADWICSVSSSKRYDSHESKRYKFSHHNCVPDVIHIENSRRSQSAPPFHIQKRRYISLNHCSVHAGKLNARTLHYAENYPEAGAFKYLQQSFGICDMNLKSSSVENFRPMIKNQSNTIMDLKGTREVDNVKLSLRPQAYLEDQSKDFTSKEFQDSIDLGTKWRNGCPQTTKNTTSCDIHNQDSILDIYSGLLHLTGDSLIPKSINKSYLEGAKVLQQVDKKFIPVVAGGTLVIIDQHAADERIRLEDLRHKVLSGEGKSVTYLDAEQELVLPEIGYQLLHNYAEEVEDWGWICNIHTQGSRSFNKNLNLLHQQPTVITLLAVPCILGVNLSDVDLLEFLQQLADTDGSSKTPPSVLRVLNSKACRGAIMFGDLLLPSECALIVEELNQTSLCFQCAHGRPTTVPLVNMEAMRKQIAQLDDKSSKLWHGLCRREISLERARQRLKS